MSTTELREKLDALGIEHLDSDLPNNKQTRWNKKTGGWGASYVEITRNSILPADSIIDNRTLRIYDCPPEQAIAVTLGSGECENVAPDYLDFLCSKCGFVHYHSDENDTGDGNDWNYCPHCGKAVKR